MKNLVLVTLFSLVSLSAAYAAPREDDANAITNPFKAKQRIEEMAQELKLTEEQTEQFKGIFKEQFMKHRLLSHTLRDEARSSLKAMLTEEQMAQLEELMKNRQSQITQGSKP